MAMAVLKASLCSIITALSFITPAVVAAQQAQEAAGSELESVTVTARRVAEDQQKVPEAILVLSPTRLAEQNIVMTWDLEKMLPGLAQCCGPQSGNGFWIRGVPGASVYLSGAPISSQAELFDSAGVQLLYGPQGTLFGINNTAGAIQIEPIRPSNKLGGFVEVTEGNYGHQAVSAGLNIPLVDDKLILRLSGMDYKTDGYVYDILDNIKLQSQNFQIGRASLLFKPTDNFENFTMVNYYHKNQLGGSAQLFSIAGYNPNGAFITFANSKGFLFNGMTALQVAQRSVELGPYTILGTGVPGGPRDVDTDTHVLNTTTLDLSQHLTLKNIFSFESNNAHGSSDYSGTPVPTVEFCSLPCGINGPTHQFSEEFQVLSKLFQDKLSIVAGSYNQWNSTTNPYNVQFSETLGNYSGATAETNGRDNGLYGSGTLDFGDWVHGLSMSGGVRESWSHRNSQQSTYNGSGTLLVANPSQSTSFQATSYEAGIQYQIAPQTLLYLTNSTGSRAGGFNGPTLPIQFQTYGPESLNNVEFGVKSMFDINSMEFRTNLSVWRGWYTNMQLANTSVTQGPNNTPIFLTYTANVGKATVEGVDGQIEFVPVRGLELRANFNYNNNYFTQYTVNGVDRTSAAFVYSPKWQANIGANYTFYKSPDFGKASVGADYDYTARVYTQISFPRIIEDSTPGWSKLDMNLKWADVLGKQGLDASLYVTNVANTSGASGECPCLSTLGFYAYTPAAPRMFGVTARYSFE
jgi:iron complex outermembrane receptor protein